jgi:hypothetical protein
MFGASTGHVWSRLALPAHLETLKLVLFNVDLDKMSSMVVGRGDLASSVCSN